MTGGDPPLTPDAALNIELARDVRAPAIARTAVGERLLASGVDGSLGQTIVLLVSEVVSNAVRHSSASPDSAIALQAVVSEQAVRVAVTDAGAGFTPRPRDPERIGEGYGLYLLEKAASSWGVERGGGTTVWFELQR